MARAKKQEEVKAGGAPGWMVTYGDLMTLLLTFFVLIVSFSHIQEVGFQHAIGSLQGALGVLNPRASQFLFDRPVRTEKLYAFMATRLKQTSGEISDELNFISEIKGAEIQFDDQGLRIILPAEVLFKSGSAEIEEVSFFPLRKIGAFLFENKSSIVVEGHTDNIPPGGGQYPSNWELSVARSGSVMRFFYEICGIPFKKMSIAGYGEYNPIASNDTPEGRMKNRRVEVVILAQDKPESFTLN